VLLSLLHRRLREANLARSPFFTLESFSAFLHTDAITCKLGSKKNQNFRNQMCFGDFTATNNWPYFCQTDERSDKSIVHLHENDGASQTHCLLHEATVGPLLVKGCSQAKDGIGVFLLSTTRQVEI
jgi:hypothetical protein